MEFLQGLAPGSRVLLINPPVVDTREEEPLIGVYLPFGLLRLASWLRRLGFEVELLDCLRDPWLQGGLRRFSRRTVDCGNQPEEGLRKPLYHFGLDPVQLATRLATLRPPDLVAISTLCTWHLGATRDTVCVVRQTFPGARVVVGGNAVTLCPAEARTLGADWIFTGDVDEANFMPVAMDLVPALDPESERVTLRMIKGCPNNCSYCATPVLNRRRVTTCAPRAAFAELLDHVERHGVKWFEFYDDFVLYRRKEYMDPLLEMFIAERPPARICFPLGFPVQMVDEHLVARLAEAGVDTVYVALETIDPARAHQMRRPNHLQAFFRAIEILHAHGYAGDAIRVFYLVGLPDQTIDEILRAILLLYHLDTQTLLTSYTLTPGTEDMRRYADRVRGLDPVELAPCLWRFAHPGMRVRDLDFVYQHFFEKSMRIDQITDGDLQHPVIDRMKEIIRSGRHLPRSMV